MPEVPFLGWPRPLHPRTHPLSLHIPREANLSQSAGAVYVPAGA